MVNTLPAGIVGSLWRYPVKSMQGEELSATDVLENGLLGDRAYALVDVQDGKVASAKNSGKWPNLFSFRANYLRSPVAGNGAAPVRITLPNGRHVDSQQLEVHELLSQELGHGVRLQAREQGQSDLGSDAISNGRLLENRLLEKAGPNLDVLQNGRVAMDELVPMGNFFDLAVIHLLTTGSLERLCELYPQGRFEVRRFRPNLVVHTDESRFVENDWVGRTLRIGDMVRLEVTRRCRRCVMTTLSQADLPSDPRILKTVAKHNEISVGVYAKVLRGGMVRRGDVLELEANAH